MLLQECVVIGLLEPLYFNMEYLRLDPPIHSVELLKPLALALILFLKEPLAANMKLNPKAMEIVIVLRVLKALQSNPFYPMLEMRPFGSMIMLLHGKLLHKMAIPA